MWNAADDSIKLFKAKCREIYISVISRDIKRRI